MSGRPMPTGFPTGPLVDDGLIPPWMHALTGDVTQLTTIVNNRGGDRARLARMMVKARNRRAAAVLVLLSGRFDVIRRARAGCPTTRRSCCSSEPPRCASTVARSLFLAVRTTRGGLPGAHRTAGGAGGDRARP